MTTPAFKDHTVSKGNSGALPTSITLPSYNSGDMLFVSGTFRAPGLGATRPMSIIPTFGEVSPSNPPGNFNNIYEYFQYKIAGSEPGSYTLTLNAAVQDAIVCVSSWDTTVLSGSITTNTKYGVTGGGTSASSNPFRAGIVGSTNTVTNLFLIYPMAMSSFGGGTGTLTYVTTTGDVLTEAFHESLDSSLDMGAGGYMFHYIYEEYNSDDIFDPATTGTEYWEVTGTMFQQTFVWEGWAPGFTAATAVGSRDAWG